MCPGVWSHLQGWELCGMALSLRGWGLNVWNQMWTELCFQKMGALFGKMQQMEQGGHSWNRSFRQCHTQCVVVSTVIFLIGHSTHSSALQHGRVPSRLWRVWWWSWLTPFHIKKQHAHGSMEAMCRNLNLQHTAGLRESAQFVTCSCIPVFPS